MNSFCITHELPSAHDYCQLRQLSGLSSMSLEGAETGLSHSLFFVGIYDNDTLIAMGRFVGDLGCFNQIVDIAVHPDYRRKGLAHLIMEKIMEYIDTNVPKTAITSLLADVDFIYEKYGFVATLKSRAMILKR